MNIFLVTRKEYDIRWGEYSQELVNVKKAGEIIKALTEIEINNANAEIITSIFSDDAEPAKALGKLLGIEKIKKVRWLTFVPNLKNQLPAILQEFINKNETANIIIVACRAVIATLLGVLKKDFSAKIQEHNNDEFYYVSFLELQDGS